MSIQAKRLKTALRNAGVRAFDDRVPSVHTERTYIGKCEATGRRIYEHGRATSEFPASRITEAQRQQITEELDGCVIFLVVSRMMVIYH